MNPRTVCGVGVELRAAVDGRRADCETPAMCGGRAPSYRRTDGPTVNPRTVRGRSSELPTDGRTDCDGPTINTLTADDAGSTATPPLELLGRPFSCDAERRALQPIYLQSARLSSGRLTGNVPRIGSAMVLRRLGLFSVRYDAECRGCTATFCRVGRGNLSIFLPSTARENVKLMANGRLTISIAHMHFL